MANINKVQAFDTVYDIEDSSALHTSDVVQATGTSTAAVMSQKAVTTALNGKAPSGYGFGEDANVFLSDIDNITKTGFYQFITNEFDGSDTNYYLIHQIHNSVYACQTAIKVINANIVYQRTKNGGEWGGWISYITSGNIGSQETRYSTYAYLAERAQADGDGNNIASTYATKSALDGIATLVESLEARVEALEATRGYTVTITSDGTNEVECIVNGQSIGTITSDGDTIIAGGVNTIKFNNTYADGCYIQFNGGSYYVESGGSSDTFTITSNTYITITNAAYVE